MRWLMALALIAACGQPSPPADDDDVAGTCGNGVIEGGERCDDGNDDDGDGCLSTCEVAACGDGYVYAGVEECDDGNNRGGDACTADCLAGVGCGNGILDEGEVCDDGNIHSDDGCLADCRAASCGDGFAQLGSEQCDDGNQLDGDGCNADCSLGDKPNGLCPGIAMTLSLTSDTHVISNTFDASDETSHSCGGAGNDAVYAVTPQADGWMVVTLGGMQGGDAVLAVRAGDCAAGDELACADAIGANGSETAALPVSGGQPYYVFVDGATASPIHYELGLHLQQEIPGDDCPGIPITVGPNASVQLTGDTSGATSDRKGEGTCGSTGSTKELVYQITPTSDGILDITVTPEFDAVVYARVGSCTHGMQVACSDSPQALDSESLSIDAVSGTHYSVFVDGYQGQSGLFALEVTLTP